MPPQWTVPSIAYSVPLGFTFGATLVLILGVLARRRQHTSPAWRLASRPFWVDIALLSSIAGITALTLNPKHEESDVQLIPFRDIVNALASPVDKTQLLAAAANVLLFMPFGAALNMRGLSLRRTALVGVALTACVEGAQLLFVSGRTASIDDLLFNTLGTILGYALLWRWMPHRDRRHI